MNRHRVRSLGVTSETMVLPRAAIGDAETPRQRLERLYRSSRDDVYAYVATLLGDRALAEDVTAIAFERAFRRRRLFNPRRGSERAWLFGIARNAALDELRRRSRNVRLAREVADADEPDAGSSEDAVLRATVRAGLAELTPRERELVALKFHAGLSNREIARVLRVSESNAGTLLHRTITKLRKACDEQA
jgi:RNA polymerase sigma-70 factor (ECF subfamily)